MDPCSSLKEAEGMSIENILSRATFPSSLEISLKLFETLTMYEVSFLEGASVLESTHQCIFLHNKSWNHLNSEDDLTSSCILTYCQCMNKSMHYLTKAVLDADIYEGMCCKGTV